MGHSAQIEARTAGIEATVQTIVDTLSGLAMLKRSRKLDIVTESADDLVDAFVNTDSETEREVIADKLDTLGVVGSHPAMKRAEKYGLDTCRVLLRAILDASFRKLSL